MSMGSSVELLDKTRMIQKLLNNNVSGKVVFSELCRVIGGILHANILVLSKKGKVLGFAEQEDIPELREALGGLIPDKVGEFIDQTLNERFLDILSTHENVHLSMLGFAQEDERENIGVVTPIVIAGERLGTVFLYRRDEQFSIDDIILCEYGTTVVGLEMLRALSEETAETNRKKNVVKSAIGTLSYTEMHAIVHIFEELGGSEGILVTSKIADRAGITRSVVVNALRKFESAGVIESRSSGMKGTYIKVLNDAVYSEIGKMQNKITTA